MIRPQSLTVIEAWDPVCAIDRHLYLNGDIEGGVQKDGMEGLQPYWIELFNFDCENELVHVYVVHFLSIESAREILHNAMENSRRVIRCGGVTDMLSLVEFAAIITGYLADD